MGMMVSWMLVAAAVAAFSITALSGCVVIPALHRLHFGQTIRESGPTWHNKKQGTPTMGGLCLDPRYCCSADSGAGRLPPVCARTGGYTAAFSRFCW